MRQRAKVDGNQPDIVKALVQMGCSVLHLHQLGHGAPDLLVGFRKKNILLEVKDPSQPPSKQKLTGDEQQFFNDWAGSVFVVKSPAEAMRTVWDVAKGIK